MSRLVPVCLATLLCACDTSPGGGGSGGGGGLEPGDGVPLSALCTAWGEAYCRAAVVCGSIVESQREACARLRASACDLDRAVAQVEEGRVAYDGVAYGRCLERFAAAPTCLEKRRPWLFEDDADCVAAAVGQVAVNGSCGEDFGPFRSRECAGGRCYAPDCGGTCMALPGVGESCGLGACARGLRCLDGTCRTFGADGEPCNPDGSGCAGGLFCRPTGSGAGRVCARPLALGTACDANWDTCASGYCPMFPETSPAVCIALAAEGEPCESFGFSCQPGLFCPNETGANCRRQGEPGESCAEDRECLAPSRCNVSTGSCERLPIVGEPCSVPGTRWVCAAGWCDGTACRLQVPNGEPCTADDACGAEEAECVEGVCATPWCEG